MAWESNGFNLDYFSSSNFFIFCVDLNVVYFEPPQFSCFKLRVRKCHISEELDMTKKRQVYIVDDEALSCVSRTQAPLLVTVNTSCEIEVRSSKNLPYFC